MAITLDQGSTLVTHMFVSSIWATKKVIRDIMENTWKWRDLVMYYAWQYYTKITTDTTALIIDKSVIIAHIKMSLCNCISDKTWKYFTIVFPNFTIVFPKYNFTIVFAILKTWKFYICISDKTWKFTTKRENFLLFWYKNKVCQTKVVKYLVKSL